MIDIWKIRKLKFKPLRLKPLKLQGIGIKGKGIKGFGLVPPKKRFQKDTDWDGTPDFRDCRPFNPLRQDLSEYEQAEMLTRLSDELEKPEEPTEKQHKSIYVFDGKRWFFVGSYENNNQLDTIIEGFRAEYPQVIVDEDPNLEGSLNRGEFAEKVGRVKEYAQERGFAKNIKKGLQIKKVPKIKRTATLRIRRFQVERRLTPEEKLSPNYQQKSPFPQTSPYRPLSVQQCMPRLPLISSPFIQRVREGRPYETIKQPQFFPPFLGNQMFRPRFLGRRAINEEEIRELQ